MIFGLKVNMNKSEVIPIRWGGGGVTMEDVCFGDGV